MGHQTYMYRKNEAGEVESQVFDSDDIPKGWSDSPAKLEKAPPAVLEKPVQKAKQKKRGD